MKQQQVYGMTIETNSFYCTVPGDDRNSLSFVSGSSDLVIGITRSFSGPEYWNEAVPSVTASFIPVGLCFGFSNCGIAKYLYLEDAVSADFSITVSAVAPAPAKRAARVSFRRHSAPMVRRVSCGHLSSRCTAFTL